jgi:DNA-binding response OmpR family regulator
MNDSSALLTVTPSGSNAIQLGPLEVLPNEHMALAAGHTLMLSSRELDLLVQLARHAGRILPRAELARLAWGRDLRAGDRSVDVYVRKLRVKLEQAAPGWQFIHTHVGFGYRLAPMRAHDAHSQFTSP